MRIAMAGPSGTGKTTLAKYLAEEFNLEYIPGSSGLLMKEFNDPLPTNGHRELINYSSEKVEKGLEIQKNILLNRIEKFKGKYNFITDRSPLDNMVYMLMEVSHNASTAWTNIFYTKAFDFYKTFDIIIYIQFVNEGNYIEDNGSRITNPWFQEMSDAVFKHFVYKYFAYKQPKPYVLTIDYWNLDTRRIQSKDFIQHYLIHK